MPDSKPDAQTMIWMYRMMLTNRIFEVKMQAVYMEGKSPKFDLAKGIFPGEYHISAGQEPCAVGIEPHLLEDDWVGSTHRCHHVAFAHGLDGRAITAELLGKRTGLSGGLGGHMHLYDAKRRFSTTGIIGEGLPTACGAALAFKMQKSGRIAVAFTGDGAINQGAFHETVNLASVWQLPLVIVIENNQWAVSVPAAESTSMHDSESRAAAYGVAGFKAMNNDPEEIYALAEQAVSLARNELKPSILEIMTSRLEGHFMGDAQGYRSEEEISAAKANDPIDIHRLKLIDRSILTVSEADLIEEEVNAEVDQWISDAREAEYPEAETVFQHVYA